MLSSNIFTLLALATLSAGHMHLSWPPALKGDNNPNTAEADPFLNYPYGCCGKEVPGPCHGHVDLLNTDEGKPVVTWAAGQKVNFTLSGEKIESATDNPLGGTHYGGSCQVGFSTDSGKTFKVATTWNGNCPLRDGTLDPSTQVFDFTVPADTPSGDRVLFAWTWVNREKEFNMNCASVTISGTNSTPSQPDDSTSSSSAVPSKPSTSAISENPAATSASSIQKQRPSSTQAASRPTSTVETSQFTLQGCSCSCPYQTWSQQCSCYDCDSPSTKRHLVARKALVMHKRAMQNAEKLNVLLRRAEAVAFNSRPEMLLDIDYTGAECHSEGDPTELQFPDPGPNVVEGDGEYKLAMPTC